jgi:D-serine deaminase-like pyridoxal phosphate-dependent protein
MDFTSLPTPAFLVDADRLQSNTTAMREKALRSGVAFRPHVKTHKTVEIARVQHGGATGPITVSTLAEAEFFADHGFRDITYAFPIAPAKLERAAALARRVERLNVLIDSSDALEAIESFHRATDAIFDLFLEIDCGYGRAGVDPDSEKSVALGQALGRSPAVRFHGVLTHAGHSYDQRSREAVLDIAKEEQAALTRYRERLGAPALVRSVGSTPTASVVERFEDCDEVRPGNYVFFDASQVAIGSCTYAECAATVLTSVVGVYPERHALIVDAGALALSKDIGPDRAFGFGVICTPDLVPLPLTLSALSQEHGKVVAGDGFDWPGVSVGTRLRIIPNHSCLTAALFDRYYEIRGREVTGEFTPVRGW